jgi:uncharacterized protein
MRGSHPEGADLSALEHLLGEHHTIPSDMGLFRDVSHRLHPSICEFTSTCFYDGQLNARPELAHQALGGETPLARAGLWLMAVEHDGNQVNSPKEVEAIARLVEHLISGGVTWRDADDAERSLVAGDVLVAAPFGTTGRNSGGHSGQAPGAPGAGGDLLADHLAPGGSAAWDGVSV